MTDYILREDALKAVIVDDMTYDEALYLSRRIVNIPSADVVPVRHGRWERKYIRPSVYADLCWHCSVCEAKYPDSYWADKFAYCPDCGAKMDKEGTNEKDNV